MKIAIIGTGYVGLVSGTCFSEMGNTVYCVDKDENKIARLTNGDVPIYEPGLEAMVLKNVKDGNLFFTTNLASILQEVAIVFIAVGTPMGEDGSADLQYVYEVAEEIGSLMDNELIIVNKSTVPVGTADKVKSIVASALKKRNKELAFEVVSNPEFLKEGDAINDFMKPDRVLIGANTQEVFDKMKELYSPFFRTHDRFITMDVRSAEMTKYAANAMLATKISFMNEIANICERLDANVNNVRLGIGSDRRIGYSFIYPGIGYGGTCFPKDIAALIKMGEDHNYLPELVSAVESVNKAQKKYFLEKIVKRFGDDLTGETFAIWGLAFKPGTDDMREAPSTYVISELVKRGATIQAYDPKAMHEAKEVYLKNYGEAIRYCESKYDAVKNATALVLLTEWKEFRSPDFLELNKLLNNPIIFDGRNQYKSFNMEEKGFEYYQIGVN